VRARQKINLFRYKSSLFYSHLPHLRQAHSSQTLSNQPYPFIPLARIFWSSEDSTAASKCVRASHYTTGPLRSCYLYSDRTVFITLTAFRARVLLLFLPQSLHSRPFCILSSVRFNVISSSTEETQQHRRYRQNHPVSSFSVSTSHLIQGIHVPLYFERSRSYP
jgi:hypothetical protein